MVHTTCETLSYTFVIYVQNLFYKFILQVHFRSAAVCFISPSVFSTTQEPKVCGCSTAIYDMFGEGNAVRKWIRKICALPLLPRSAFIIEMADINNVISETLYFSGLAEIVWQFLLCYKIELLLWLFGRRRCQSW